MKKYIDYLFWKRTWFRVLFLFLPIIPFGLIIFLRCNGVDEKTAKNIASLMMIMLWAAGIYDNENVDCPPNPFKKNEDESEKEINRQ